VFYDDITAALGYKKSPLFREDEGGDLVTLSDRHWIRSAREAGVKGSYFFRTSPEEKAFRPAVHIAEAKTVDEARSIHRKLWNQGVNPFLIVVLPGQVRVFTGFAFDPDKPEVGAVTDSLPADAGITRIIEALSSFTADAINRGEIWQRQAEHLVADQRVDTTLLKNLEALGDELQQRPYSLLPETSHALIGKFVYLSYLRARKILDDKWLKNEAGVEPTTVFNGEVFSADITLESFRKLVRTVEHKFNGKLFPIAWGSRHAPRADAIRTVARVFAGEETKGQMHLSFKAYDFASIPVEFISSIYEQFLHAKDAEESGIDKAEAKTTKDEASDPEKRGAHYTPEPLADYLVSEVNSVKPLRLGMKILDCCCGSGIFLVMAYRRLVELECERQKRVSLNAGELKALLVNSIYAVERNRTACQISGFSLILAMLSYVDPPELHRCKIKFPTLIGYNLFREDFFDDKGMFWKKIVATEGKNLRFDYIIGNPPWVELKQDDPEEKHVLAWSKTHVDDYGLARARTGEAFAWRVMECLATDGIVGLILHAKTLTNDHLLGWRQKFFGGVQVHRITNFANLVNLLFPSAKQPAFTLIYTRRDSSLSSSEILHLGPFVANQCVIKIGKQKKRRLWTIGFSESEIKTVPTSAVTDGNASVWKMALWGNSRDMRAIQRLQQIFSTRLGKVADSRGWKLALGLQLRNDKGTKNDPNEEIKENGENVLEELQVLNHLALVKTGGTLIVPNHLLVDNTHGNFVRKGRVAGLELTTGPRLFLWNNFAAFSNKPFIIQHDKVCLAGGTAEEMKAVAAIWNSSFASYLLFFVTTAAWGIGYSLIDKGDAENLPFPELTPEREQKLCAAWEEAAALEAGGTSFSDVKALLDRRVAAVLKLPASVSLVVSEFFRVRYQLDRGKNPPLLRACPEEPEMKAYALRLRSELDGFLGGKAYHKIVVLYSPKGICVSVTLTKQREAIMPEVRVAEGKEAATVKALLEAAETKFSQWVYVKRSIRLEDGNTIHLIKPPRRLEWTETNALLDADDFIAETIEERSRREK
jgi:hypothetical protein